MHKDTRYVEFSLYICQVLSPGQPVQLMLAHSMTITAIALQAAKHDKLKEMAEQGIPEKYRAELARFKPFG